MRPFQGVKQQHMCSFFFGTFNVEFHQCIGLFKNGGIPAENHKLSLSSPTEVDHVCVFPWSFFDICWDPVFLVFLCQSTFSFIPGISKFATGWSSFNDSPGACLFQDDCVEKLTELFDKNAPCYLPACTFNGRYQPTLGARRFVAFSAFSWVVDVLGLPAETTALEDIENAARWGSRTMFHLARSLPSGKLT